VRLSLWREGRWKEREAQLARVHRSEQVKAATQMKQVQQTLLVLSDGHRRLAHNLDELKRLEAAESRASRAHQLRVQQEIIEREQ
jgi:hypothetical protein